MYKLDYKQPWERSFDFSLEFSAILIKRSISVTSFYSSLILQCTRRSNTF